LASALQAQVLYDVLVEAAPSGDRRSAAAAAATEVVLLTLRNCTVCIC
jgi:hypothetical protein